MGGAPSRAGVSEHTSTGRAVGVPGEGLATVGFQYASRECRCATANMKSAENRNVVDSYLETEVGLGRVIGPLEKAGTVPIQKE